MRFVVFFHFILGPLIGVLIVQTLGIGYAWGGVYEMLSAGAFYVSSSEVCPASDPEKTSKALDRAVVCREDLSIYGSRGRIFLTLADLAMASDEEKYFSVLADQHARELACASDFAKRMWQDYTLMSAHVEPKLKLLREFRLRMMKASNRLSTDPNIHHRMCPVGLDDLAPSVAIQGQTDEYFELCKEIILTRTAYQTVLNSIPLANVPPVLKAIESYASAENENELPRGVVRVSDGYYSGVGLLAREASVLQRQALDPERMDRQLKRGLLRDPRVITRVLERSGHPEDLKGVACRADARYGQGAEALDKALLVGSLALGGGVRLVAKAGMVASRVYQGAAAARGAGLLSVNSMRVLQMSSFAMTGLSHYAQLDKACLSSGPGFQGKGTENNSCVAAPTVTQMESDNCVLALALSGLGFHVAASSLVAPKVAEAIKDFEAMEKYRATASKVKVVDVKTKNEMFNLAKSPIGRDKNSLYIGVANTEKDGSHHYYLLAGDKRYDGIPLFSKSVVRDQTGSSVAMPQGVIFKVNVPDETMEVVAEAIAKRARSRNLTCFHGLCKVLDESGVEIKGMKDGKILRLKPVMNGLFAKDVKVGGQALEPNRVQAFATSEDEVVHFFRSLDTAEAGMGSQFIGIVAPGGIFGGGYAVLMYQIFKD